MTRARDEEGQDEGTKRRKKGRQDSQRRKEDLASFAPRGEARPARKGGRARLTMRERKREKHVGRGRKKERKKRAKKAKKKKEKKTTTTTKEEGETSSVGTSPPERTTHVDEWLSTWGSTRFELQHERAHRIYDIPSWFRRGIIPLWIYLYSVGISTFLSLCALLKKSWQHRR